MAKLLICCNGRSEVLKVEKRGDSCFISHNNLTLFINKYFDKKDPKTPYFRFKVTRAEGNYGARQWFLVGDFDCDAETFHNFATLMSEL